MVLKIGYTVLLIILYLSIECSDEHKIKMGTLFNDSKIDIIADYFSNFSFYIGKKYLHTNIIIHVMLPTGKDNDTMLHIMEKTLQKILKFVTVITNDSYSCDRTKESGIPYHNDYIRHIPNIYLIPMYGNKCMKYFNTQKRKIEQDVTFNPRAKFILIQLSDRCGEHQSKNQTVKIFNEMWSMNSFHTTMLILSQCDLELTVVTANPFSPENTCRTAQKRGMKYFYLAPGSREINIDVFQEEPKNYRGCVFWVGTRPLPPYVIGKLILMDNKTHIEYVGGIEIEFIRLLSALMNFKYKFYKTHSYKMDAWYKKLPNGTVMGISQDTVDRKIDIAFAGAMPSLITYNRFDQSTCYKFSSITWYLSNPKIAPQWKILFGVFHLEVWILSGVVFLMVSLLYYTMDIYNSIKHFSHKALYGCNFKLIPFTNLFSTGLGLPSTLNPKTSYIRVLFFSWAMYSLHWCIAYTSILFTLITNPPLEKEIITIRDLKESGLKIGVDSVYLTVFNLNVQSDEVIRSVMNNSFPCNNNELCMKQFLQFRNFSLMERIESVEYLVNLQQSKIHKLSDNLFTYFISIITNKGNPLSRGLNNILLLSMQSGLLQKWEKDVVQQYHNIKHRDIQSEEISLPLKTHDLKGAFYILVSGFAIASIVCIIEVATNLFKEKPQQNKF